MDDTDIIFVEIMSIAKDMKIAEGQILIKTVRHSLSLMDSLDKLGSHRKGFLTILWKYFFPPRRFLKRIETGGDIF